MVLAHELALVKLNAIVSVEAEQAPADVFAAWLATRTAARGIRHVRLRDISKLSDATCRELFHDIGGAHLLSAGFPCTNMSGA